MSEKPTLFELKEKAKWSHNPEEKKTAIRELTNHGVNAVPSLEEILNITAYEDIKRACAEAIKVILANAKGAGEVASATDSNSATAPDKMSKTQKKEEKSEESVSITEPKLADLPP
jgi:hypothetical protein